MRCDINMISKRYHTFFGESRILSVKPSNCDSIRYERNEVIMLKIEHLTKIYGEKKAVDDLNLHIQKGEIFGFIGHNVNILVR